MHLKSYQIDGRLLRAGAANLSAFGLKRQDNDLVLRGAAPRLHPSVPSMRVLPAGKLWRRYQY
jgi:hypothetical protein